MIELNIVQPTAKIIRCSDLLKEYPPDDHSKLEQYPSKMMMDYVGRVCYNSYSSIKEGSYKRFISHGAARGHRSISEFGTFKLSFNCNEHDMTLIGDVLENNPHITFKGIAFTNNDDSIVMLTGSPRAFIELLEHLVDNINCSVKLFKAIVLMMKNLANEMFVNWQTYSTILHFSQSIKDTETFYNVVYNDISDIINTTLDETKILVLVQCDRSSSHEIVRHRPCSFLQESQRYVRYSPQYPYEVCLGTSQQNKLPDNFTELIRPSFELYSHLLDLGRTPEDARVALPNCTKTKLFIYCDKKQWRHFFRMRQTAVAYPPVKEIFDSIYQQFIDSNLL